MTVGIACVLKKRITDMSESVEVSSLPDCDLCQQFGTKTIANYDALTIYGPWGYLCNEHFQSHGIGLGTGRGQKLILRIPENS